jgi:hypothetical protein
MKRLMCVAALGAAAFVAPDVASSNGTYVCTGQVGGFTPALQPPQTIDANVDVPAGSICSMYLVTVTGNVTVEGILAGFGNTFERNVSSDGGQLFFPNPEESRGLGGSTVLGNISVDGGSTELSVRASRNVTVDRASSADFTFANVGGNVSVTDSDNVLLDDMSVGGNLNVIDNGPVNLFGDDTGVVMFGETIGGNLNCEGNDPAPVETGYVRAERATGQCTVMPGV